MLNESESHPPPRKESLISHSSSPQKQRWIQGLLGLLVTIVCLWWAVKDIDWQDVRQGFSQARYESIPLYLLFLGLFFVLKAIRWAWLLRPVSRLQARQVASPMMIGFMGNNLLPAHLGEFFRVYLLGRQENISTAAVFSSVVIERLLDVFAVLVLVGIGLLGVRDIPESFQQAFLGIGVLACVSVIVLVGLILWMKPVLQLATSLIQRLPVKEAVKVRLTELVHSASLGATVFHDGKLVFALLLNSLLQWACNGVMIYISLRSFGLKIPFTASLVLLGVLVFAVTIPSTPGFFGAIQLAFVKTLALFSVAEGTAFAASIYYHLLQYLAVTGVGLWCLARSGLSLTRLQHAAEEVEEDLETPPAP